MRFATILAEVQTRIILSAVFATLIAPLGMFWRLLRIDPLRRRRRDVTTYRVPSENRPISHMEVPY